MSALARHGLAGDHVELEAQPAARFFLRSGFADTVCEPHFAEPAPQRPQQFHVHRFGEELRQSDAARAAYRNGEEMGWRAGFASGMRWGLIGGGASAALLVLGIVWIARAIA